VRSAAHHDVVDVWRLRISTAPIGEWTEVLSSAERAQAERFVHQRDRDRFGVMRGWLRTLLGDYLNQSPGALAFETGEYGKPALAGQDGADGLRFNVSHSGDVGAVAICRGREVGVDVEEIRSNFDVIELGRSCFSADEHDALCECDADARLERFFQLWTAKEAYIKALGGGLSIPLEDFTVKIDPHRQTWRVTSDTIAGGVTSIRRLTPLRGYAGAVTAVGADWEVREYAPIGWHGWENVQP
jgi:4'-phosphopantetheinyl transferase